MSLGVWGGGVLLGRVKVSVFGHVVTQNSSNLLTNIFALKLCILFISIPEHFSASSKLRQKHYSCLYNFRVCTSTENPRGSPESKECLGIDIQSQKVVRLSLR